MTIQSSRTIERNQRTLMRSVGSFSFLVFMIFLHVNLKSPQLPRESIIHHKDAQNSSSMEATQSSKTSILREFTSMPPLIMISGGCVGSTAALQVLKEMIQQTLGNGIRATERMEILVERKNPVYQSLLANYTRSQPEWGRFLSNNQNKKRNRGKVPSRIQEKLMVKAIKIMHQQALQQQKVFVFKASWNILVKHPILLKHFYHDMNARFTGIYRQNFLDTCVCFVRDCLGNKQNGYPRLCRKWDTHGSLFSTRPSSGDTHSGASLATRNVYTKQTTACPGYATSGPYYLAGSCTLYPYRTPLCCRIFQQFAGHDDESGRLESLAPTFVSSQ